MILELLQSKTGRIIKIFRSKNYNYNFYLDNGKFERWGETYDVDPEFSPFGPEILDIEVSTICNGVNNKPCSFCYKSNTGSGTNMSFDTFKDILDKFPKYDGVHLLTQVAFGIGNVDSNPDLWSMMQYCRDNNIIPNVTINGDRLTDEIVKNLVKFCGAISVSLYDDKDVCYDAVKRLSDAGCKQVNIHSMLSEETFVKTFNILNNYRSDIRLKNLNAIVMLSLKQKGRGEKFTKLCDENFATLVRFATRYNIPIGFDSCGCNKLLDVAKEIGKYDEWIKFAEPCESAAFSSFIDVNGKFFPCSFADKCTTGIDCTSINDFKTEVWDNKFTIDERKKICDNNRSCPYFEV